MPGHAAKRRYRQRRIDRTAAASGIAAPRLPRPLYRMPANNGSLTDVRFTNPGLDKESSAILAESLSANTRITHLVERSREHNPAIKKIKITFFEHAPTGQWVFGDKKNSAMQKFKGKLKQRD